MIPRAACAAASRQSALIRSRWSAEEWYSGNSPSSERVRQPTGDVEARRAELTLVPAPRNEVEDPAPASSDDMRAGPIDRRLTAAASLVGQRRRVADAGDHCTSPGAYIARRFSAESSIPTRRGLGAEIDRGRRRPRPTYNGPASRPRGGPLIVHPSQGTAPPVVGDAALGEAAAEPAPRELPRVSHVRAKKPSRPRAVPRRRPRRPRSSSYGTSYDEECELPARECLGLVVAHSIPRNRMRARRAARVAVAENAELVLDKDSSSGTKAFGAPRSPSYFGTSYSRIR
jgi:hypothetical protein